MSIETGVIIFLAAMLAVVLFVLWAFARRDLIRRRNPVMRVRGKVVGHHTTIGDGRRDYRPTISFFAEGKEHETSDSPSSTRPQPPVGSDIELEYPQDHPELARVPQHPLLGLMPYAVGLFMAGGLVTMLAIMVRDL